MNFKIYKLKFLGMLLWCTKYYISQHNKRRKAYKRDLTYEGSDHLNIRVAGIIYSWADDFVSWRGPTACMSANFCLVLWLYSYLICPPLSLPWFLSLYWLLTFWWWGLVGKEVHHVHGIWHGMPKRLFYCLTCRFSIPKVPKTKPLCSSLCGKFNALLITRFFFPFHTFII